MPETLDHPVLTNAQAAVLGALLSKPDTTAQELAEVAGTGGSTTAKALALLEEMGLALRDLHQPKDGRQVAATWQPTAASAPEPVLGDDAGTEFDVQEPPSEHERVGYTPAEAPISEKTEPVVVPGSVTKNERLASGGLRTLVIEMLVSMPNLEFTPTSLSHLLGGRSAGAVAKCVDGQQDRDRKRIEDAAPTTRRGKRDGEPLWRRSPDGGIEFYYPPNKVVQRIRPEELDTGPGQ